MKEVFWLFVKLLSGVFLATVMNEVYMEHNKPATIQAQVVQQSTWYDNCVLPTRDWEFSLFCSRKSRSVSKPVCLDVADHVDYFTRLAVFARMVVTTHKLGSITAADLGVPYQYLHVAGHPDMYNPVFEIMSNHTKTCVEVMDDGTEVRRHNQSDWVLVTYYDIKKIKKQTNYTDLDSCEVQARRDDMINKCPSSS